MKRLTIDQLNSAKPDNSLLTAISFGKSIYDSPTSVRRILNCICSCGKSKKVTAKLFRTGKVRSCGCIGNTRKTHGLSRTHPLYYVWFGIKSRCNPLVDKRTNRRYADRGIKVCDEWLNSFILFYNWCIANGYKRGLQIDRIDNNGNYEPSNCRFVTNAQNSRNKENTVFIEYKGIRKTIPEWAEDLSITRVLICSRLKKGLPIELVLSPVSLKFPNKKLTTIVKRNDRKPKQTN